MKTKSTETSANPIGGKIYALILTIIILLIGTFFYFTVINNIPIDIKSESSMDTNEPQNKMISGDKSITENNSKANPPEINIQNYDSLYSHILQENRIFTKRDANDSIELFYYYTVEEPIDIQLKEGDLKDYEIHTIGGQYYYPLILGSEEAKAMREEEEFNNIGDPIKNFYGKNVVVIGVMKKSDNVFDMIHITPLNSGDLN